MYVTHLESAWDGTRFEPEKIWTVHQGRPLWVRYDLKAVRAAVKPEDLRTRPPSLWRYWELLPLPPNVEPVTLGEGMTPLLACPRLGRELGLERLWIKDESQLPTGSFKSRGMTAAVSMARHLGLARLAIPTAGNGGGTGLIGMWKAFQELLELGWLTSSKLPRLVSCQSDGCAPIVRAFEQGKRLAEPFANAQTVASGLRVPAAVGDFMMLDAIRASDGCAVAGSESRILEWMKRVASTEGIGICPETAVCFDCLEMLRADGRIRPDEQVVVFNTGAAQ